MKSLLDGHSMSTVVCLIYAPISILLQSWFIGASAPYLPCLISIAPSLPMMAELLCIDEFFNVDESTNASVLLRPIVIAIRGTQTTCEGARGGPAARETCSQHLCKCLCCLLGVWNLMKQLHPKWRLTCMFPLLFWPSPSDGGRNRVEDDPYSLVGSMEKLCGYSQDTKGVESA